MCSLKESGYRGRHKCGVTLLSGGDKSTKAFGLFQIILDLVYPGKYPPPEDGEVPDPIYEEFKDAPTIFVGAAHCNYICKDMTNPDRPVPVETCCCRKSSILTSCRKGSKVRFMISFTIFLVLLHLAHQVYLSKSCFFAVRLKCP